MRFLCKIGCHKYILENKVDIYSQRGLEYRERIYKCACCGRMKYVV